MPAVQRLMTASRIGTSEGDDTVQSAQCRRSVRADAIAAAAAAAAERSISLNDVDDECG